VRVRAYREQWNPSEIKTGWASPLLLNQLTGKAHQSTQNGMQVSKRSEGTAAQANAPHRTIIGAEAIASSLDPENVRQSLLAGINYFARLALHTTGKPLAYNLSHEEWTAVSRIVSQL